MLISGSTFHSQSSHKLFAVRPTDKTLCVCRYTLFYSRPCDQPITACVLQHDVFLSVPNNKSLWNLFLDDFVNGLSIVPVIWT